MTTKKMITNLATDLLEFHIFFVIELRIIFIYVSLLFTTMHF